jgi:peptide deformylase
MQSAGYTPRLLRRTQFGNPILRVVAQPVPPEKISSDLVQHVIGDMRYTLERKKYGVGLAAPQVGISLAIAVVAIKPTPSRPELERFEAILINPVIEQTFGKRTGMWEACISGSELYGKVPRYKKSGLPGKTNTAHLTRRFLKVLKRTSSNTKSII